MLAGALANPWVLGRLFAPDGAVDGEQRILQIAFVDMACLFTGAGLLWASSATGWRRMFASWWITASIMTSVAALVAGAGWGVWAYTTAHHHTTDVAGAPAPTEAERAWADDFVRRSFESVQRHGWLDFDKAIADGFELQWGDRGHWVKREFLFDDAILDPERPEYLMYETTPRGRILVGLMFYTRNLEEHGPTPGGSLATWHFHPWAPRGYCAERDLLVIGRPTEGKTCVEGAWVGRSAEMMHVWFIEHPLGRFADAMSFPSVDSSFNVTHLHPVAVHFTIALIFAVVLFDILGRLTRRDVLHAVALANLVLAGLSAVATIGLGMAAEVSLNIRHDVHAVLDTHKLLGFAGAGGILLLLAWRTLAGGRFPARAGVLYLLLGAATAGAVGAAGYVGGQLVYQHGVAVNAIDRAALERYERTVYGGLAPQPTPPVTGHAGH